MITERRYTLVAKSPEKSVYLFPVLEDTGGFRVRFRHHNISGLRLLSNRGYAGCLIVSLFNPFPITGSAAAGRIIRLNRVESLGASEKTRFQCAIKRRDGRGRQRQMDGAGINPLAIALWKAQNRCL